jgi:hypothetical protein
MLEELVRADRLSDVISHTTPPAFLLGAIAGLLAIMLNRVENLQRDDPKHEIPYTKQRVRLLQWAVFCSLSAAIAASLLVIGAFIFGFLNRQHVYGVGGLFLISFGLLTFSLGLFAREIWLSLKESARWPD